MHIQRIICPVDFSEFSLQAYRLAVSMSDRLGAALHVLHCVEVSRYASAGFVPGKYFDDFRQHILSIGELEINRLLSEQPTTVSAPQTTLLEAPAPDGILELARAHNADLIVMGTHGRRGLDRLALGSVTERVIRAAPCPVLAVHRTPNEAPDVGGREQPAALRRILVCTDFSVDSRRALDYAVTLATEYGAELTLLHVLEDIPRTTPIEREVEAVADELDGMLAADAPKHLVTRSVVRVGRPYQQIIHCALETHVDLIVMAVQGRSALDLAVFGSTTHRVIQLGPSPVLAARV